MKQRRTITTVSFLLLGLGLHAQEIVSATGGDGSGAGGSVSYTIGQTAYDTHTNINGSVAQGVQQPYEISTSVGIKVTEIMLNLTAYPNPTNNSLTLSIDNYNDENLKYQLHDIQGRLLLNKKVTSGHTILDLTSLPASAYLLHIKENSTRIKTFRIIKN
jgi:hypothetical protein